MKRQPEHPIVIRLRFDTKGKLFEESTFATECELGGVREQQTPLPLAAGERPVETAGPLFAA